VAQATKADYRQSCDLLDVQPQVEKTLAVKQMEAVWQRMYC